MNSELWQPVLSHTGALLAGMAIGAFFMLWYLHDRVTYARGIERRLDEEDTAAQEQLQQEAADRDNPSYQPALVAPSVVPAEAGHTPPPMVASDLTAVMPAVELGEQTDDPVGDPPVDDEREAWPGSDGDGDWQRGVQDLVDAGMDAEPTPTDEEDEQERVLVPAGMSLPPATDANPTQVPECRRGELIARIVEHLAPAIAVLTDLRAKRERASSYKPRHASSDQGRKLKLSYWSPLKASVRLRLSPTRWAAARERLAALSTVAPPTGGRP